MAAFVFWCQTMVDQSCSWKCLKFLKFIDKNIEFLVLSWILSWQILKFLGKILGFLEFLNKSFQILKFLQNPSSYFLNKVAADSCFLLQLKFLSWVFDLKLKRKEKKSHCEKKKKQEVGSLLDWNNKARLIWKPSWLGIANKP